MACFAVSTFSNVVDGLLLSKYTGELGGIWAKNSAGTGTATTSKNGDVFGLTSTTFYNQSSVAPANQNWTLQADWTYVSSVGSVRALYIRGLATAQTGYGLTYSAGAAEALIIRNVAGTQTNGGTVAFTPVLGTTYRWIISATGTAATTVTAWIYNASTGALVATIPSFADALSDITGAGSPMLFWNAVSSETTGDHFDNICAWDYQATFLSVCPFLVLTTGGTQTITVIGNGTSFVNGTTSFTASSGTVGTVTVSGQVATVSYTPNATGVITLTETTTGSNVGYFYVGQPHLTISPTYHPTNSGCTASLINNTYTTWAKTTPTITVSGPSGTPATFGTGSLFTTSLFKELWQGNFVTAGCSAGAVTFTDTNTGATGTVTLGVASTSTLPGLTATFLPSGVDLGGTPTNNSGGWVAHPIYGNGIVTAFNSLANSGAGEQVLFHANLAKTCYAAIDGPSLGMDVTVSVTISAATLTNTTIGVCAMVSATSALGITCAYNYGSGTPTLILLNGISTTNLSGTITGTVPTLTLNTDYLLTITINGTAITGTISLGGSVLATITKSAAGEEPIYTPGYAGLYYDSTGVTVPETATTGMQFGVNNFAVKSGPRCTLLNHQSGATNFPSIPFAVPTQNYLWVVSQNFIGAYNDNTKPNDLWLQQFPLNNLVQTPAIQILNNAGSDTGGAIFNQWSGSNGQASNWCGIWLPGVGSGPSGRLLTFWTYIPGACVSADAGAGAVWCGISSSSSCQIFTAYTDNEGTSWSSPVDITTALTGANVWTVKLCGPSNCVSLLPNGKIGLAFWVQNPVQYSGTFNVMGGSGSVTSSVSAVVANGAMIGFPADSSKGLYLVSGVSGISFTITPVYGGSSAPTVIAYSLPPISAEGGIAGSTYSSLFATSSAMDGSGFSVVGNMGSAVGTLSNEVQYTVMPNGNPLAIIRVASGGGSTFHFTTSTASGVGTWPTFTPASFPMATPVVTYGIGANSTQVFISGPNDASARALQTVTFSSDNGVDWNDITKPAGNYPGGTQMDTSGCMYSWLGFHPNGDVLVTRMVGAAAGTNPALQIVPLSWLGISAPVVTSFTGARMLAAS